MVVNSGFIVRIKVGLTGQETTSQSATIHSATVVVHSQKQNLLNQIEMNILRTIKLPTSVCFILFLSCNKEDDLSFLSYKSI